MSSNPQRPNESTILWPTSAGRDVAPSRGSPAVYSAAVNPIAAARGGATFGFVRQILNDIEAGKMTDELRRRGIPPRQRLRVVVESIEAEEPSVTVMNAAGGAFDWLAEEPDLYSDRLGGALPRVTGIPFGAFVLTDFPFTDLTSAKRWSLSTDNDRRTDVVVAYITSIYASPRMALRCSSQARGRNFRSASNCSAGGCRPSKSRVGTSSRP
jgi:hypothetical protein